MCKVSVLVPVYNVKKYLRQCLDSLASQTLESIEFVCIDDGSTDGCSEILDEYAARDVRFRVIHKANSGYGASMNVGLRVARGEYIGIVESDDYADAEMFDRLYQVASTHQAEVVRSNYWATTQQGSRFQEELKGHPYGKVFEPMADDPDLAMAMPNVWSAIYRRDFLEKHNLCFNETPGASFQDLSFAFLVITQAKRYVLVKDAYLHYRMDNAGSSTYSKAKVYCVIDEYDAMERYLLAHDGTREQYRWAAKVFALHCEITEGRLERRNVFPFWQRALERLQVAHVNGWFDHEMVEHPEKWIIDRIRNIQQRDFIRDGFLAHLRASRRVYLYGAGEVAKGLVELLRCYEVFPSGILVSQMKGNPDEIAGFAVCAWQSASADCEHDVIVIAVTPRRPEVQQEIFFALEQAGYRNIIVLTEELRQALAQA